MAVNLRAVAAPPATPKSFAFRIWRDFDGQHRWKLTIGDTIIRRSPWGFSGFDGAYGDIERLQANGLHPKAEIRDETMRSPSSPIGTSRSVIVKRGRHIT